MLAWVVMGGDYSGFSTSLGEAVAKGVCGVAGWFWWCLVVRHDSHGGERKQGGASEEEKVA